jgi:hypothetical protein
LIPPAREAELRASKQFAQKEEKMVAIRTELNLADKEFLQQSRSSHARQL